MKNKTIVWSLVAVVIVLGGIWFAFSSATPALAPGVPAPVISTTPTTTPITTKPATVPATVDTSVAGPGEHCGGNMTTAKHCEVGYTCTPTPGSHLPFGDVGGTCVRN